MPKFDLFPRDKIVGVFRGFREGGLEFHADLVLPYKSEFQSIPMHGQYLLVQLETPDEAVLGRISSLSAEGKFTSSAGEEFNIRAIDEDRRVPEDLREQYLRYRVNMRVLGVLRSGGERPEFVPSHRRLPHVGSPIAFLSHDVLQDVAGHNEDGAALGFLALGEYIYAGKSNDFERKTWMQVLEPEVRVKFPVSSLVSRRSFVFARAGFGKSNLVKLLFSNLYAATPQVAKRGGRTVPVGTIIFDPDGEYFWPDDKGRPGLCNVPSLADNLVVFTSRSAPSPELGAFVASGVKLDIRTLKPSDVIGIALSPERQEQQNVRKLRSLSEDRWRRLVNLAAQFSYDLPESELYEILGLDSKTQQVEATAAKSNIVAVVKMLHDGKSMFMDMLLKALSDGKLCVVDLSQMRGQQGLILSGLILRKIFDHNQDQFTASEPKTIPTIAVIEEAQSVLGEGASGTTPFVEWVKEGRKYDLGAVMVTQQPGSIPQEILSQGDNWFVFHVLSAGDLQRLKHANAHFSDDLLSSLLNEPIQGHGIFWSSASEKPYPVSVRVLPFESCVNRSQSAFHSEVHPYASKLKSEFAALRDAAPAASHVSGNGRAIQGALAISNEVGDDLPIREDEDGLVELWRRRAVERLVRDADLRRQLESRGVPWGRIKEFIGESLPDSIIDRERIIRGGIRPVLTAAFGAENEGWHGFTAHTGSFWVRLGAKRDDGN